MGRKDLRVQLIEQREVYELAFRLARQIQEAGFQPDLVVGIARGGLVPARYLCDFLSIDMLAAIKIKHYDAGSRKRERASLEYPLGVDIAERKVLLADDVNDTGETLRQAHAHLLEKNPARLVTAVLHEKETTAFAADYRGAELAEWRWITYPWARVEDLSEFAAEVAAEADSLAELASLLQCRHEMAVTVEDLRKIEQLGKLKPRQK